MNADHGFRGMPGAARVGGMFPRGAWRVREAETVNWSDRGRKEPEFLAADSRR